MTPTSPAEPHGTDIEWQRWGEIDPYYAVITDERYRRGNLTPEALSDFFESGRSHLAHVMRVCQRKLHAKFAPQRALDFGCGVGRVLVAMAESIPEVVGVDVSDAMRAEARRNCDARGLTQVTLAPSDDGLSALEGTFDLIHSVIVFQHIEVGRGHALVARLLERLRPGGIAALHFTYARASHEATYGQPPPVNQTAPAKRSAWRLFQRTPAPLPAVAAADPEMLMNPYPLNEILFSAQRHGVKHSYVEFTDHGGEWGVILYLLRLPR